MDRNRLTANSGIVLSVVSSKPKGFRGYEIDVFSSCCITLDYVPESSAALFLSDITLRERSGQVMVRRGKGNKARRVPLNAEARAVIRDYLQLRPSTEVQHLLVGQRGEPLSAHAIYDVVVKYGRLAGLDEVSPHTLRHTFARTLLVSGTPINDVADLLGHSSLDTTRIYTKASETDLATVVARLENW